MEFEHDFAVVKEKIVKTDRLIAMYLKATTELNTLKQTCDHYQNNYKDQIVLVEQLQKGLDQKTTELKVCKEKLNVLEIQEVDKKIKFDDMERSYLERLNAAHLKYQEISMQLEECQKIVDEKNASAIEDSLLSDEENRINISGNAHMELTKEKEALLNKYNVLQNEHEKCKTTEASYRKREQSHLRELCDCRAKNHDLCNQIEIHQQRNCVLEEVNKENEQKLKAALDIEKLLKGNEKRYADLESRCTQFRRTISILKGSCNRLRYDRTHLSKSYMRKLSALTERSSSQIPCGKDIISNVPVIKEDKATCTTSVLLEDDILDSKINEILTETKCPGIISPFVPFESHLPNLDALSEVCTPSGNFSVGSISDASYDDDFKMSQARRKRKRKENAILEILSHLVAKKIRKKSHHAHYYNIEPIWKREAIAGDNHYSESLEMDDDKSDIKQLDCIPENLASNANPNNALMSNSVTEKTVLSSSSSLACVKQGHIDANERNSFNTAPDNCIRKSISMDNAPIEQSPHVRDAANVLDSSCDSTISQSINHMKFANKNVDAITTNMELDNHTNIVDTNYHRHIKRMKDNSAQTDFVVTVDQATTTNIDGFQYAIQGMHDTPSLAPLEMRRQPHTCTNNPDMHIEKDIKPGFVYSTLTLQDIIPNQQDLIVIRNPKACKLFVKKSNDLKRPAEISFNLLADTVSNPTIDRSSISEHQISENIADYKINEDVSLKECCGKDSIVVHTKVEANESDDLCGISNVDKKSNFGVVSETGIQLNSSLLDANRYNNKINDLPEFVDEMITNNVRELHSSTLVEVKTEANEEKSLCSVKCIAKNSTVEQLTPEIGNNNEFKSGSSSTCSIKMMKTLNNSYNSETYQKNNAVEYYNDGIVTRNANNLKSGSSFAIAGNTIEDHNNSYKCENMHTNGAFEQFNDAIVVKNTTDQQSGSSLTYAGKITINRNNFYNCESVEQKNVLEQRNDGIVTKTAFDLKATSSLAYAGNGTKDRNNLYNSEINHQDNVFEQYNGILTRNTTDLQSGSSFTYAGKSHKNDIHSYTGESGQKNNVIVTRKTIERSSSSSFAYVGTETEDLNNSHNSETSHQNNGFEHCNGIVASNTIDLQTGSSLTYAGKRTKGRKNSYFGESGQQSSAVKQCNDGIETRKTIELNLSSTLAHVETETKDLNNSHKSETSHLNNVFENCNGIVTKNTIDLQSGPSFIYAKKRIKGRKNSCTGESCNEVVVTRTMTDLKSDSFVAYAGKGTKDRNNLNSDNTSDQHNIAVKYYNDGIVTRNSTDLKSASLAYAVKRARTRSSSDSSESGQQINAFERCNGMVTRNTTNLQSGSSLLFAGKDTMDRINLHNNECAHNDKEMEHCNDGIVTRSTSHRISGSPLAYAKKRTKYCNNLYDNKTADKSNAIENHNDGIVTSSNLIKIDPTLIEVKVNSNEDEMINSNECSTITDVGKEQYNNTVIANAALNLVTNLTIPMEDSDLAQLEIPEFVVEQRVLTTSSGGPKDIHTDQTGLPLQANATKNALLWSKVLLDEDNAFESANVDHADKRTTILQYEEPNLKAAKITQKTNHVVAAVPPTNRLEVTQINALFDHLLNFSADERITKAVADQFIGQDLQYVASVILSRIACDHFDETIKSGTAFGPLLTVTQQVLLGFMVKLEKLHILDGICDKYLNLSDTKLLKHATLVELKPLCQMYVAICKMRDDANRMRRLCCEMFYFRAELGVPFLFFVLTSWLEILKKANEPDKYKCSHVLVHLVQKQIVNKPGFNMTPLLDLLRRYYKYPAQRCTDDELFEQLFHQYLEHPCRSTDFNLLLFCKHQNADWLVDGVEQHFKPLIMKVTNDNFKATLIILVANLCSSVDMRKHSEQQTAIVDWLQSLKNDAASTVIQQSLSLAFSRLKVKKQL